MRIVALSDTHGLHWDIEKYNKIPDGDVLVHTGDFQSYGKLEELYDFNKWLGTLPHPCKLVIAGNHDKAAWETYKEQTQIRFTNAIYLQDSGVEIGGVKFWGSPWSPTFFNWYFMLDRGSDKMKRKREEIPEDTDILLTHSPPMYKLDFSTFGNEHAGCEQLRNRVDEIKPRYHIFGHMHAHNGMIRNDYTTFINAAICNDSYKPVNKPIVFDIDSK